MFLGHLVDRYLPEIPAFFALFRTPSQDTKEGLIKRYGATQFSEADSSIVKDAVSEFTRTSEDSRATEGSIADAQFLYYDNASVEKHKPQSAQMSGDAHFVAYAHESPRLVFLEPDTFASLSAQEKKFLVTQQLSHFERNHFTTRTVVAFAGPFIAYPLLFAALARGRCLKQAGKMLLAFSVGLVATRQIWHYGVYNSLVKFQEFEADRIALERMGGAFDVATRTMHKIFLAQCKRDSVTVPEEVSSKILADSEEKRGNGDDGDKKGNDDGDKKGDDGDKKDDDDDDDDDFMTDYNFLVATTTTYPSLKRRCHKISLLAGVAEKAEQWGKKE